MESGKLPMMGFSNSMRLDVEELHQTLSEGIGEAIEDAADNLQFSRHLFALAAPYERELETIEKELRSLVRKIDDLVIAIKQAGCHGERIGSAISHERTRLSTQPFMLQEHQVA